MYLSRLPTTLSKKGRKLMAYSVVVVVVGLLTKPKSAGNCEFQRVHVSAKVRRAKAKAKAAQKSMILTVFFLAKSPEAPRTTIVVFSLSSTVWLYGNC